MDLSNLTTMNQAAPRNGKAASVMRSVSQGPVVSVERQVSVRSVELPVAASSSSETAKPSAEELQSLVNQANQAVSSRVSELKFSIDEGTNINIVRIEDTETGELIRQVPSETMVAIARALEESNQGSVLEEMA